MRFNFLTVVLIFFLSACGEVSQLPASAGYGVKPDLPPPKPTTVPTVSIATAVGWPPNATPNTPNGLKVNIFAEGLHHPRWIYTLPNGDVLVAETNAPSNPKIDLGIRTWLMKWAKSKAGADTPSANRIILLRDSNGDGVAETKQVFLEGLNSPFGMALVGNDFYVANTDAIVKFHYENGDMNISQSGIKILDLPAGELNHHWTKNIIASPDGLKLYATVGSNSNIAENGFGLEEGRAAIWELDLKTLKHRIYADGLRNPNGLAWNYKNGKLLTVVNERDEIGNDLVPDYLTSVPDGSFFGWPYSYFGHHIDERVQPQQPEKVAKAREPDYGLGAHTASLGLTYSNAKSWPAPFNEGVFIGQHGSWNRDPPSGYKVIFVGFKNGEPNGLPIDVLSGFLSDYNEAYGRPVGVAMDKQDALLVADDVGNRIWRVSPSGKNKP